MGYAEQLTTGKKAKYDVEKNIPKKAMVLARQLRIGLRDGAGVALDPLEPWVGRALREPEELVLRAVQDELLTAEPAR